VENRKQQLKEKHQCEVVNGVEIMNVPADIFFEMLDRANNAERDLATVQKIIMDGLQNAVDRLPEGNTRLAAAARMLVDSSDRGAQLVVMVITENMELHDRLGDKVIKNEPPKLEERGRFEAVADKVKDLLMEAAYEKCDTCGRVLSGRKTCNICDNDE